MHGLIPRKCGIFFFFSCLHTYTHLGHCTYGYTQLCPLLTKSDFILYRECFPLCNLAFVTVPHNHSSWDRFVHIQTSTVGRSHILSSARGVSVFTLISAPKWILKRESCLALHASYMCHSSGVVGDPVTTEKMLVASLGYYRLMPCNDYKTKQR